MARVLAAEDAKDALRAGGIEGAFRFEQQRQVGQQPLDLGRELPPAGVVLSSVFCWLAHAPAMRARVVSEARRRRDTGRMGTLPDVKEGVKNDMSCRTLDEVLRR